MVAKDKNATDKYFDALTESYDAIIDAIKLGNERGFRLSNNLLAEAQKGQREAVQLGKQIAEDPTDLASNYRTMMESATKAQGRTLEFARQVFDELSTSRDETRQVFEKVFTAQRAAGEAAVEAVRDIASTTGERVKSSVERVTTRVRGEGEKASAPAKAPVAAE
jgi:DNA anti-recombination protein RmuC